MRRLLSYAGRFGVGTSAGIAGKYGFSVTNLMGVAGARARVFAPDDRHLGAGLGVLPVESAPRLGPGATT